VQKLLRHRPLLPVVPVTAAVLLVLGPAAAQTSRGEKVALLVGVKEYHDSKLPNLKYTEDDVEDLARVLRQAGGYACTVLTGGRGQTDPRLRPTRANIERELRALLKGRGKRDTVMVAFSGHGLQLTVGGKEESFFCPFDADPKDPATLLSLTKVYADLTGGAGTKLLLVDACRNDPAAKGAKGIDGTGLPSTPAGTAALFSCRPGQQSFEDKGWGHGAFFHAVLEGLGGKADLDGDGVVDFDELSRFVRRQVPARVKAVKGAEAEQEPNDVRNLTSLVPLVLLPTLSAKSANLELVLIPAGTFWMGSPASDKQAYDCEKPQHRVTISRPFYLGKYPVTVEQFEAFVRDQNYKTEAEKDGKGGYGFNEATGQLEQKPEYTWRNPGFKQGKNHPVVNVSWNDAVAFCNWLSKKEGRTFRLPTEAEWEYACRANSSKLYVAGDDVEDLKGFANIADASAKRKFRGWATARFDDGYPFTSPVGSFRPNAFGLHDMIGNVWQWCQDGWRTYDGRAVTDPVGPQPDDRRVLRGGSWGYEPGFGRAAWRGGGVATTRSNNDGFRVLALPLAATP
jgi:formylglycine-generating enzyme required for sulfatase activity